ncbi:MAG: HAMP domain-containing sensor histidine kinase [Chloroflexota bacterium]
MGIGRPSLRLLAVLLTAALPPLVAFGAVTLAEPTWMQRVGAVVAVLILGGGGILWIALIAVVAARPMANDARSIAALAERGMASTDDGLSAAQRRLATTLEDRNRQISDLADLIRVAPISKDAMAVAHAMVAGARQVTGDPTWLLAILRVPETRDLEPGVYGPNAESPPGTLDEVHRWAATAEGRGPAPRDARLVAGPWGAFTIVDVAAGDDLRAILLAPWEGRPDPSPAELNLFGLIGQHAATALEHALLYTRLRVQTEELNRMAAVQTDFLRGITHDLQTPLTSIRAVASELQQSDGVDDTARNDLETIAQQADRLRRMVGQLLAVSRLEVGALTPVQEVFRVAPVVRRTWDALRAGEHRLVVEEEGPPHLVVADPDRLEQVLWALMDNAVKYSPAGSTIRVHVGLVHAGPGDLISEIAIRDQGVGMDPTTRAKAFEQFFRSDDARRLVPDGSGIGLYAARGLVVAMGGGISIESEPKVGTTVRLTLPAETTDETGEDDASQEPMESWADTSASTT